MRASLQVLSNCLTIATLEIFPTESRAMSWYTCYALGLTSGLGLPFFTSLNTVLLLLILIIFINASIGLFFVRETKREQELRNLYTEIYPEDYF